jgi:RNA polymerase sigma-70 factor (ECF subfamily)
METHSVLRIELMQVESLLTTTGFEELYRDQYPRLIAVAKALTGNRRDGEDAVQDTMVKAFVRWDRVGQLAAPGAWCHRVLLNGCRSRWRRTRTQERFMARARHDEPQTAGPSADVIAFWDLVRSLPTRPRMVVTLHFAGERTMAEIAAILGVPEGTVRSDIARARVVITAGLRD